MTTSPTPAVIAKLVDDAKVYAALSGTFDPKLALPVEAREDVEIIVAVASALAEKCDTNPDSSQGWLLRTPERRYALRTLGESGKLHEAIERRRTSETDAPTDDLLRALEGAHPFAREDIERDLSDPPSEQRVERIIVALDRAGESAPGADLLANARATLAKIQREARRDMLRDRGFFGRSDEKERLLQWFAKPQDKPPVRAAFLYGLPGIGKSALLEEMVSIGTDRFQSLNVRLDFDRAGLSILDQLGLTMEVARQVGERLGEAGKPLLDARLSAASLSTGEESVSDSRQIGFPRELAGVIGEGVRRAGRPVLLVLDTLEVLRARGEQHPRLLFEWIDNLALSGVRPLRIIAAGRGEALDSCPDRVGEHIALPGLDPEATDHLLDRLELLPRDRAAVTSVASGNPLVLRLAADVVKKFGAANLPRKQLDKEVAAAFLYRFLLSRIEDPQLRRLAHPGLIVRRISAAVLRDVLAPALDLPPLSPSAAGQLFDSLASEHWLVDRDPLDPEFVVHRSDMRLVLLPLLYREEPAFCARIDAAAVTWFGQRDDPASQLDAAYHRLQLMRTRKGTPLISDAIVHRIDEQMLAELPDRAQQLVARGKGARSAMFRGASGEASGDNQDLVREILNLLERQDWAEGQYVVDQAVSAGGFDARSSAADAVRAFWWGAGRWHDARRLLAERDALGSDDADLAEMPRPLMLARLEMRAEFEPRRLAAILRGPMFQRLTDELARSPPSLARHGALAFLMAARDGRFLQDTGYGKDVEPVAAAFEQWAKQPGNAARQAIDSARERLASRGASVGEDGGFGTAQLLALHSPYVRAAATLATQEGYSWLIEAAADADQRLSTAGGLFHPPLLGTLAPLSSSPVAGIAGLGLLAEWLEALAFTSRDSNLRAIGRAAERWRRTVAGAWQYGRPPAGWADTGLVDLTLAGRIDALLTSKAAVDAPSAQLALWAAGDDPRAERIMGMLQKRLPTALRRAAEEAKPMEKAAKLLRWNVPSAFVPPLSVILHKTSRRTS